MGAKQVVLWAGVADVELMLVVVEKNGGDEGYLWGGKVGKTLRLEIGMALSSGSA